MQTLDLLRAFPFLRQISAGELASLRFEREERPCGVAFFEQGDPGDAVYGVLTGQVKISKQSPRGRDVILEIVGPGEIFAAVAVMRRIPMPASAVAMVPTACIKLEGLGFKRILDRRPELASRILEMVSRRLLEANASRLDLATEPVETRLARALLRLGGKFGYRRNGGEVVFTQAFTRQNLAEIAGTTVETTIRTLSRWNRDHIVYTKNGHLTILRPEELERLLEFRP